jgi:hypothetical protein
MVGLFSPEGNRPGSLSGGPEDADLAAEKQKTKRVGLSMPHRGFELRICWTVRKAQATQIIVRI